MRIEEALGIKISKMAHEIKVAAPSAPDMSFSRAFDSHLDNLWFVIPVGIFKPLVHRHFLKSVPWETVKNLSRLAVQWSELINKAIKDAEKQAREYVRNQILTVDNLLAQKNSQADSIALALKTLE
ncbi:MAG: hypothetical protein HQK55_18060 [Deltaproteobacteria bacterium]|nr:hypothetical protein [Deltaproteobacteria bacterium]